MGENSLHLNNATAQMTHPLFNKQLPGKWRLCFCFLFICVQTPFLRICCLGCDFHLVSFLLYHLFSSVNPSFLHRPAAACLSDLLWNPSLEFTEHISSRDLKTLHSGGKMSWSPLCLILCRATEQFRQTYRACQTRKQSRWETGSCNS